ncbi:MAG: hypothetical protein SFZ23_13340 [Planctomycetota bacterium]|nr:hypothetical protein [Planctomycetota bacterium]
MPDLDLPILRKSQIQALGLAARELFFQRLAEHVAEVFPSHAQRISRPQGRAFLEACVQRGRAYAIREARALALFTDLIIALGERFDDEPRHAWIREILQARGLSGVAKMHLVYRQLPDRCPEPPVTWPADWLDGGPRSGRAVPILVAENETLQAPGPALSGAQPPTLVHAGP